MKKITLISIILATFATQSFAHCPIPQWCPEAPLHQTLCPGEQIEEIEFPSVMGKTLIINWWTDGTRFASINTPDGITVSGPPDNREHSAPVSIKGAPTAVGTHHYTVSNTCGVELLHGSITLNASIPNTPGTITFSPVSICTGTEFTASIAAVSGADFYTWTTPASMTADGSDSTTLTVTNAGTTTGTLAVSVTASNSCGISSARTQNITVGVAPTIGTVTPTVDRSTPQNTAFNPSLTISPATTGTPTPTIQWYSSTTATNTGGTSMGSTNGANTNTFAPPNTTLNFTGVYYYAVASNSCGRDTTSNTSGKHIVAPTGCDFVAAGRNLVNITSASFASTAETTIPAVNGLSQQIWSAPVTSPQCTSRGNSYNGGADPNFNVDCRAATNGFNGHYFSWCAVMKYADILCPGTWRVPTVQDFIALDVLMGGNGANRAVANNATNGWTGTGANQKYTGTASGTWGGARWTGDANRLTEVHSLYWSSSNNTIPNAYSLYYYQAAVNPLYSLPKHYGIAVRCVR